MRRKFRWISTASNGNDVHPSKTCSPIDVIDDGSPSKEVNEVQDTKATSPIDVIYDGSPSKEVNEVHE